MKIPMQFSVGGVFLLLAVVGGCGNIPQPGSSPNANPLPGAESQTDPAAKQNQNCNGEFVAESDPARVTQLRSQLAGRWIEKQNGPPSCILGDGQDKVRYCIIRGWEFSESETGRNGKIEFRFDPEGFWVNPVPVEITEALDQTHLAFGDNAAGWGAPPQNSEFFDIRYVDHEQPSPCRSATYRIETSASTPDLLYLDETGDVGAETVFSRYRQ